MEKESTTPTDKGNIPMEDIIQKYPENYILGKPDDKYKQDRPLESNPRLLLHLIWSKTE